MNNVENTAERNEDEMNKDDLIKKQTGWLKAIFGCLAAIVAAIIIFGILLVPKIYQAVDGLEKTLVGINILVNDADDAVQNINKVDFDHLKESVDNLTSITRFFSGLFGGSN